MLGLISTAALEANRALNARRKVFYDFPNGKFPLMGLLSLAEDMEELSDPEFGWWEESWKSARTKTKAAEATHGPLASNATGGTTASEATHDVGTTIYLAVESVDDIRVRDIIRIKDMVLTDGKKAQVTGYVTAIDSSAKVLTLVLQDKALATTAAEQTSDTTNNGKYVTVIGTAAAEGDRSKSDGTLGLPFKVSNYTQIFRTVVGPFTGTALKMGQAFDSKPSYRKAAKENALRHMEKMEKALLFGVARTTTTTNADGDTVPLRYTGGIEHFLTQWDKGNTTNGGSVNYRPGGDDLSSVDWNDYEEKRVIRSAGTLTSDQWEELIRRMFMSQSDGSFQKLVICGDKALAYINHWVQNKSIATRQLNAKDEAYGLQIKEVNTIHGDLLFKTHPLFKEDPAMQNMLLVLDVGDIGYHCLEGRDTELLKNRQNQDADYRKDEWLTECGFEVRMPKRHMLIDGLTGILS